jgi:hypothetical protein
MAIEAGALIVIVGEHPDKGKFYKIGEVRQDGWILTTDNRLFHHQFFDVCSPLKPRSKRGSKTKRTEAKRSTTLSPPPCISIPSNEKTLLGDTGILHDGNLATCHLSSRKVPEVPEGLLGDTGVFKNSDRIQSDSTKLSPSKVMEVPEVLGSLLGDTGVLDNSDPIQSDSTELSPSNEEVRSGLPGDTSVLDNSDPIQSDSTELSPSKKDVENIKRPRRRRGQGSGYFIITYSNQGKYGCKYPQTSYQVEFGKRKRSIYLVPEKVDRIRSLDRMGLPIGEILEAIDSPKAREVLEEYERYLEKRRE